MNIGVIEGFFGRAWSWEDRHEYVSFLNQYHYSFYIYAPKNDAYLRRKWFEKWPQDIRNEIHELAGHYRSSGIQFGVGLSPFELFFHYKCEGQKKLPNKINELNTLKGRLDVEEVILKEKMSQQHKNKGRLGFRA